MISLQDEHGLVFWPERDVATLTPEFRNRWRAVLRDGSVAFRPTPPPPGPWVPLGNTLVTPELMQKVPAGWADPAGFLYPDQQLPLPPAPDPEAHVPGLPCRRNQIYSVTRAASGIVWHTDVGDFEIADQALSTAAVLMPELVCAITHKLMIHPERLRRLKRIKLPSAPYLDIIMDNGVVYRRAYLNTGGFLPLLGLERPCALKPYLAVLWGQLQLRDWPFDLTRASQETLRAHFPTSRRLIANLIWQQFRYRQLGIPQQLATSHGALWYKLVAVLYRAGFLKRAPTALEPDTRSEFFRSLQDILTTLIKAGLFTYKDLGFINLHPENTRVGTRRPDVVLITEKQSLTGYANRLADEFGVSLIVVEGLPQLIAVEQFRDAYIQLTAAAITPIAFVDYDTIGWISGSATADMLEFYKLQLRRPVQYLITGDVFTAEEKRLYARPLPSKHHATKNAKWLQRSGGVDGQPLGIHSNHVQPYERVRDLFWRLLDE